MNKIDKLKKWSAVISCMLLCMFSLNVELSAQNLNIRGKVIDSEGNSLPGTAVVVKGTTTGTATNDGGDYTLSNVPKGSILEFKLVGFITQEIKVADKTDINVILAEEAMELDDVTVVAFSTQRKESVMASISTLKPTELKVPSSNLTTAFAGRIAGLISYQTTGEPGMDNAQFFIRGITTFGDGRKNPLILIDGVEMSSDDLARLTTDDIKSFSVMKDANATALYGARGANGVIMVTTKEGKEGKAKIQFRTEASLSAPTRMIDVADPLTYMKMNNEAARTRSFWSLSSLPYDQADIWARERILAGDQSLDPRRYPMVDWTNMLFKDNTINHRYNLNVSGGGAIARYYVAASFNRDNGIINMDRRNNFNNNIAINKYALRTAVNINLSKTTEIVARLNAAFDDYSGPIDGGGDLFNKARNANPVRFLPYYEPDEANQAVQHILFGNDARGRVSNAWHVNPYAEMVKGYRTSDRSSISSQFELKQDLKFVTEGLTGRALFNVNRYSELGASRTYDPHWYNINSYFPNDYVLQYLNEDQNPNASLTQSGGSTNVTQSMYFETALQYSREFAKKHALSGLLVFTLRNQEDTGKVNQADVQLSLPYRNVGFAGRATYGYDSRYFVEFNFGYNGSERFAEKERFGFFPSVGLGYLVSNEAFMESIKDVFSKLKLKATYGFVGNDDIGSGTDRFFYLSNMNTNVGGGSYRSYRFGQKGLNDGAPGPSVEFTRYADPNITWEISRKTNFGIELNFWNSLEIQVDYALEKRSNILQTRVVPVTMGLNSSVVPKANIGEASGKAVEVSVDYNKSFNKDFWTVLRGTFTYAASKFDVYEEMSYLEGPRRSHLGQKISQRYGYIAERLFLDEYEVYNSPSQSALGGGAMAGDIKYKDINGDYKIDRNDKVPIGHPFTPEINYGFGISAGFRNVDFSCFFAGSARSSFWIDPKATAPFVNDIGGFTGSRALLQYYADDHWDELTRNSYALWPRLSTEFIENNGNGNGSSDGSGEGEVLNTWFMRDGSYLRLKSVELGYSLPKKLINALRMQNIRFYASGSNLFVISKFKMWDPEMGSNGLAYPIQRVFNLGLTIDF
jgi:TonB-linked SusC/RagA family outer membrane protein